MSRIAEELKQWRQDFSITQEEARQLLQYSRTSYQAFEAGRRLPPYREMQRIRQVIAAAYYGAEAQRDWGVHL